MVLGELEWKVLEAVWKLKRATVRDVLRVLADDRPYTTIMTTLDRLYWKGLLGRRKVGKAYEYFPRLTRREMGKSLAKKALEHLVRLFGAPAVVYFVDALREFDPKRVEELRRLLGGGDLHRDGGRG